MAFKLYSMFFSFHQKRRIEFHSENHTLYRKFIRRCDEKRSRSNDDREVEKIGESNFRMFSFDQKSIVLLLDIVVSHSVVKIAIR